MKHIASCSFGKDSVASIICRIEHGESIDNAIYCRVMFDNELSAELPEHEEWIYSHAIPMLEKQYDVKTTIVQAEKTYTDYFYTKYQKGGKVGQIYGFPYLRGPWCNDRLKTRPIKKMQKQFGEHISIIGIAADEYRRITRNSKPNTILPLVEYGITEKEAFAICKNADMLSPAYNGDRERLGCWFCHNQRIGELRRLRSEYPLLWQKLMVLDRDSPVTFRPNNTLCDFDKRFEGECN